MRNETRIRRGFLRTAILLFFLLLVIVVLVTLFLLRPPRSDLQEELFQGTSYTRLARSEPRPLMVHIVEIDTSAPGIALLVTPGDASSGMDLYARTTEDFLDEFDLQVAINGSFFEPFVAGTWWDYYPKSGDPVNVKGLSISKRENYSTDYAQLPALCLLEGEARIEWEGCPVGTTQALAGNWVFVRDGVVADNLHDTGESRHPRTAVAVDATGQTLWLIVVDGRQAGYSEGVSMAELADIVLELGADDALNLDGGGSSTLVAAGRWGSHTLNSPIHTRIPMRQRPVANHLGVYARPADSSPVDPK